jgi:hypothetical protein
MNTRPPTVLLALAAGTAMLTAGAPVSHAADKGPQPPSTVTVLGQTLALKTNTASPVEELVAEYVPAKETLDHWTLMLGVRIFKGQLTPDQALAMKGEEVSARRAQGD